MPLFSSKAFILKTSELNEQDKLIHLYTQDRGLIKGIAPGALKSKNRFGSKLELFTKLNVFYYHNETKELVTLTKADLIKSYFTLISKELNIFYFYLISELILKYLPHNHKESRIFKLIEAIFEALEDEISIDILSVYFLIWIQRIEGKMFNPYICYNCKKKIDNNSWLALNFEGILCSNCKSNEEIKFSKHELDFIKWTERNSPKSLNNLNFEINIKNLIYILLKKIEFDAEINLKSKYFLLK